jgi:DNA repair exonuclease SbcCD ATPase subunit
MRLAALEVTGFRGFTTRQTFDLDADCILLIGSNGQGKTSLFDAILWGLTGRVRRFAGDDKLLSLFSDTGTMQVGLTLKNRNKILNVRRTFDGAQQRLTLHDGGDSFESSRAESQLVQQLRPGAVGIQQTANLESALIRGVYLQQDRLRDFIEAEDESARFAEISELVGTGRLNDLQVQLDNARSAWTRATNTKATETDGLRKRLATLESQLSALGSTPPDVTETRQRWTAWWSAPDVAALWKRTMPAPDSSDASVAIDQILKELQAARVARERLMAAAKTLATDIEKRSNLLAVPNLDTLRDERAALERKVKQLSEHLSKAREAAADERKRQVTASTAKEELEALAQLAIRHLGEHCPVCDQIYDRQQTTRRLQALLGENTDSTGVQPDVDKMAADLSTLEKELVTSDKSLKEAERTAAELENWNVEVQKRLQDIGLSEFPVTDLSKSLSARIDTLQAETLALRKLQDEGEKLALLIARAGEEARRSELQGQIHRLRTQLDESESSLAARNRTAEEASSVLESLREAASDIVEEEIRGFEPLLQRIYTRIDPHPAFRVVRLLSTFTYRRGRVSVSVEDPIYDISSDSPSAVLSSSQLNSLALSLFLSLNLGVSALPLDAALLDDPLQTLDNVNLLGVMDLLKRTRGLRQLIISTHDERFGRLLERKLRPVSSEQKTRVFELEGWTRKGPSVHQHDTERDFQPLKIAV